MYSDTSASSSAAEKFISSETSDNTVIDLDRLVKGDDKGGQYCMSTGCVQTAAAILSNMDFGVDPCRDFYQFACGGFIKKTSIPDDRTRVSSFSVLGDLLLKQVIITSC